MDVVGRVVELWRYPVKSLLGERLEEVTVTAAGFDGDRRFAIRNKATGHVLSAKKFSTLLRGRAAIANGGGVTVTPPEGPAFSLAGPDSAAAFSAWLGFDVEVVGVPAAGVRPEIEGDERVFLGRAGAFFDSGPVHIVTTSTLAALTTLHPYGRFDPRRFRPNIVLSTPESGFVEESWIGKSFLVGEVELEITKKCARCVMTTHAQEDLPVDRDILRTVNQQNDEIVGVYGVARREGRIWMGDEARVG